MQCGFKLRNCKIAKLRNRSRGYMMITLMLALALISLAMLAALPGIKQQIMRDREEEMIHRGNSYMRAIQHYYTKLGRYPNRVEDLENTNNIRYLRKRYTDPMNVDPVTHKERNFKFLTQADITLNNGPVLPGQSGPAAQGGLGGAQGAFGATPGGLNGPQNGPGSFGAQPGGAQQTSTTTASGDSGSSSSNSSSSSSSPSGNSADTGGGSTGPGSSSPSSSSSSGPNGQTFGGGPILGVASTSKAKTIRVFFDKNHYKDWYFIYLPMASLGAPTGGLLTGPINPNGPTGGGLISGQTPGGAAGQGGTGPTGIGSGLGLGSSPNGGQNPILQPVPPTQGPTQGPQQ